MNAPRRNLPMNTARVLGLASILVLSCSPGEMRATADGRDLYAFGCGETVACLSPADTCYALTWSSGASETLCSLACATDTDCPDGRCLQFDSGGLCFAACRTDQDCGAGYCNDVSSSGLPGNPTKRVCFFQPAAEVNCTTATSCETCTPLVGCGWCKSSNFCSPTTEHCEGFPSSWAWETTECGG